MSVARVIAAGAVGAILTFLALIYVLGLDKIDAFYIAFTLASTISAIVAMSEKEISVGTVAGFVALILLLGLVGPYICLKTVIVMRISGYVVSIPTEYIPYISLGVVGLFVAGVVLGADIGRLGLFVLGCILYLSTFVVGDAYIKVLIMSIIGLIAGIPLVKPQKEVKFLALMSLAVADRRAIIIDLSAIQTAGVLILPVLLFIALDPFNIIKGRGEGTIEGLASISVLTIVLLQMISVIV